MTSNTPIGSTNVPLADQVVLNALPYAAVICDRNGIVMQCNEAIARLIGVSRDRMLGRKAGFISKGLMSDIEDVFSSGRTWRGISFWSVPPRKATYAICPSPRLNIARTMKPAQQC